MKHLTQTEIMQFEARLKELSRSLSSELRGEIAEAGAQRAAQAGEGALDSADQAQTSTMNLREGGMAEHYAVELADVDSALERIATGGFGVCIDCGTGVPVARLKAYPTAKRCVQCQTAYERHRTPAAHG